MMVEEGLKAKSGIFSHLFDWNRKSRKKLFANGSTSSEGKKQAGESNTNLPASSFWMNDNDGGKDARGAATARKSSEYSCASSVTDEVLSSGTRAPGVVARLMGLDALPTSEVPAPNSSPLLAPRFLIRGGQNQERAHKFDVGTRFIDLSCGSDSHPRNQAELKYRKMASSAVETFGIEVLPPQETRPSPVSQCKLSSPMRNPRFISPDNAADIMEAAARMYELRLRGDSSLMASMRGSFLFPVEVDEMQEGNVGSPSPSRCPETSQKTSLSNARKKFGDGHFNRSWNASENGATSSRQNNPVSGGGKSKGKSISVSTQANVNVQKKTGPSIRKRSLNVMEQGESRINRPVRNQLHAQQNKMEKRVSAPSTSSVLKPNNQKQNSMVNKGRLPTSPSSSNQQLTKVVKRDTHFLRNKSSDISQISSKHQVSKGNSYFEKEPTPSRTISNPRNKRLTDIEVKKNELLANNYVLRRDKCVQSNIIIDERLNVKRDKDSWKSSTDVVSFTFTSPITKAMPASWSSNKTMGKLDRSARSSLEACRSSTNAKKKALPSVQVNVISDGSVSNLMERNIHKLTVGMEPAHFTGMKVSKETSSSLGDWLAASESFSAEVAVDAKSFSCLDEKDSNGSCPASASSSFQSNVQNPVLKKQGGENFKNCNIGNMAEESDQRLPSPFSILEACFSGESCESSESCGSITGQDQDVADSALPKEFHSVDGEADVSRESPSTLEETLCGVNIEIMSRRDHIMDADEEIDYVRDILSIAMLHSIETSLVNPNVSLDPNLYDQLETKKSWSAGSKDKEDGLKRKLLFDCVSECLDLRYHHHFVMGLKSWINGIEGLTKDQIAKDICGEIILLRSMERLMVDELVDRDFCRHLGRCVDLEADSFEVGVEIQEMILANTIDEMVAEFLVQESEQVASDVTCWNLDQVDFQDYCLYCM